MSAFDDADFDFDRDDKQRKRSRSRSRSHSRGHSRRSRTNRQRSPVLSKPDALLQLRTGSPAVLVPRRPDADSRPPQHPKSDPSTSSVPTKVPAVPCVTHFPFDSVPAGAPGHDWWCDLCSNPNPAMRVECIRCGALYSSSNEIARHASEVMSDFIPTWAVAAIAEATGHRQSTVLPFEQQIDGADSTHSRPDDAALLRGVVVAQIAPRPECARGKLHDVLVEVAKRRCRTPQPSANSLLPAPCFREGDDEQWVNDEESFQSGYVVCLRFYCNSDAKAALVALGSRVAVPGYPAQQCDNVYPVDGFLRIGISPRRTTPPSRSAPGASDLFHDSHAAAPSVALPQQNVPPAPTAATWAPPVVSSDEELKQVLVEMYHRWDALLPPEREFYEANISKVSALRGAGTRSAAAILAEPRVDSALTHPSLPSGGSGNSASNHRSGTSPAVSASGADLSATSIKKRLEEKRMELERKKAEAAAAAASSLSSATQAAAASPSVDSKSSITAAPLGSNADTGATAASSRVSTATPASTVLERLAQKKALLHQKQVAASSGNPSGGTMPTVAPHVATSERPSTAPSAARLGTSSGEPNAAAVTLLAPIPSLYSLLAIPPNFPTKMDVAKNVRVVHLKCRIVLRGIPMEVASRVVPEKFL